MIDFYVSGQSMKMFAPCVAADSLNYLECRWHFNGTDWTGAAKTAHFRSGDTVYDMLLNADNAVTADQGLDLTVGEWEIYLTGVLPGTRLTTTVCILTVRPSGLIDAPEHVIPMSLAEQLTARADTALAAALAVRSAAESGAFNGRDGRSFVILGVYASLAALQTAVTDPKPGDCYAVGEAAPYNIYVFDGVSDAWKDFGPISGATGQTGEAGAVFTPSVDASGNISWSNNGGLENPVSRNIQGPKGDTGDAGQDGTDPFDYAVEHGYTGTEMSFASALVYMPAHHARHEAGGADAITVTTDMLAPKLVTMEKIADSVRTRYIDSVEVTGTWTQHADGYYYLTITGVTGLLSTDRPKVYFAPPASFSDLTAQSDAFSLLYDAEVSADGSLTLYARSAPLTAFFISLEVSVI